MTPSNGNIFRVTGPLCGEFTGHQWHPPPPPTHTHTQRKYQWRRALLIFFICAYNWANNREAEDLRRHHAYYDVIVMNRTQSTHVPASCMELRAKSKSKQLTHWGRVTHICISKLTIIGSDDGLSPDRRQAIIWTNAGLLLIGPLGTNFNEILSEILAFSFKKMRLNVSSAKRRPFCLGPNVLTVGFSSERTGNAGFDVSPHTHTYKGPLMQNIDFFIEILNNLSNKQSCCRSFETS